VLSSTVLLVTSYTKFDCSPDRLRQAVLQYTSNLLTYTDRERQLSPLGGFWRPTRNKRDGVDEP
jgi:hypothetical protein